MASLSEGAVRRRRAALTLLTSAGAGVTLATAAGLLTRGRRSSASRAPAAAEGDDRSVGDDRLRVSKLGWKTDFSKHTVPLSEIMSGGPGKDGIPPLDTPAYESVEQAARWLRDAEPVIALEVEDEARAYPLQILIWHEVANDTLGGVPVTVTFCPLCNTAIVFDRRLDGAVYDFGVSGNLRHSDLVMWDRQTESWWQQATGEAIVGTLAGKRLTMLPASIVSWREFRTTWSTGRVLSRETGHNRPYGNNPYVGYDDVNKPPFLFRGPIDGRLPPMERVLVVELPTESGAGTAVAVYPFSTLGKQRVVHDTVAGRPLVTFWAPGTTSALDRADIASSRDVGAAAAFVPSIGGIDGDVQHLTFRPDPRSSGRFRDDQTGTTWTIAGLAVAGPLEGRQLPPLVHGNPFWFAAAAFHPNAEIRGV
ncbi:MAG: DUF3179 domain-containing protein [Chloroflexi bacterium]|nr:DUF3179 domain-containing protein [Chloroflexota bacterium]